MFPLQGGFRKLNTYFIIWEVNVLNLGANVYVKCPDTFNLEKIEAKISIGNKYLFKNMNKSNLVDGQQMICIGRGLVTFADAEL